MNRFSLIFWHYFKRTIRHPIVLVVYILLPMGLVVLNMLGNIGMFELQGGDVAAAADGVAATATLLAAMFMVSFQFFSGELLIESIYDDFTEGARRWRLLASPVPRRTFLSGTAMACWVFSIAQALVIFSVVGLLFDVHWGNPLVFLAVILIVSIMSQLIAALITQLAPKRKTATVSMNILCFAMMFLGGFLFIPLGDSAIATFVQQYGTPLSLAYRAILYAGPVFDDMSQALFNLGILVAITAVLTMLVLALGRRRKA
ncbi:MAG: ABC transporter permease [Oscillospiraceae bacterium]|nr:ABC transporter permease [Oscillospiraceae bacterium]